MPKTRPGHSCRSALEGVQGVALEAVMPMFKAMVEAAQEITLRMHSQDFDQEGQQGVTQASPYMHTLTTHLNHCRYVDHTSCSCHVSAVYTVRRGWAEGAAGHDNAGAYNQPMGMRVSTSGTRDPTHARNTCRFGHA